jgi:hypothetical protein
MPTHPTRPRARASLRRSRRRHPRLADATSSGSAGDNCLDQDALGDLGRVIKAQTITGRIPHPHRPFPPDDESVDERAAQ